MKPFEKEERNQLLRQIRQLDEKTIGSEADNYSVQERRTIGMQKKELKKTYLLGLPHISIARCPFTDKLVTKEIDIYGFDGRWWNKFSPELLLQGSPYAFTYCGALNLMGKEIHEVGEIDEILTGPEVPYVIPHLLELPEVKCVIYATKLLEPQYPVYFMTYFANPKLSPSRSHQMWLRTDFWYRDEEGHTWWDIRNDTWDFELARWFKKPEKLLWIAPSDPKMQLRSDVNDCPYLNLSGRRKFLVILKGKVVERPLPDGEPFGYSDYFDP
ncbi:MAG: hypothetical protein HC877_22580 [Thioploca sp.]|nr:hypothetical protein [Thioploca sp.]